MTCWLVIRVVSPSDEAVPAISEGLIASGGSAVEQDGRVLTTWLPRPTAIESAIETIRSRITAAAREVVEIGWKLRDGEDWTAKWREGLGPRRVGDRLIIAPSWAVPGAEPNDIVIIIDPKMAFGTGEHASTRGVLRLMEEAVPHGAEVLDVGTGSGVLAIAASRLGAGHVLGVEIDGEALLNTRENVLVNGCADRITLEQAAVDADWLASRQARFDLIVANVLSGVLRPLLGSFHDALRPAGTLIIGGILGTEAATIMAAAAAANLHIDREDREDDWWTGRLVRADANAGGASVGSA